MTIALQILGRDSEYITKHNANYAVIKAAIDSLQTVVGSSPGSLSVPAGLALLFDRTGVIGDQSFEVVNATLTGPNYTLTIPEGAFWDGATLAVVATPTQINMSGKTTDTYYIHVSTAGVVTITTTPTMSTVRQFDWNSSSHVVSNSALYTTVAVLISGDDFARCLESDTFGSFTALADRFSMIEGALSAGLDFYAQDSDTTSGLDFGYSDGMVRNDNAVWSTVAGTVTLDNNDVSYIEVNPADGVVSANVTEFTSGQVPLYIVTTAAGQITVVEDKRTWVGAGGGGGGGHAQNTDTGTSSVNFKLHLGWIGVPSSNCSMVVERGTSPDVSLRWNEAVDKWQFTNDGVNFEPLVNTSDILGTQGITKYVGLDDPTKVLDLSGVGTSADYVDLDLSSVIVVDYGATAAALRILFTDTVPGASINVKFMRKDGLGFPLEAFTVWSGVPATILIPLDPDVLTVAYLITASGGSTASLKVFVLGYFERIIGVGTVNKETVSAGISVAASGDTEVNVASACNRGLIHYLKVEETGGEVTGTYDIEFYAEDTFSTLLYKAQGMSPGSEYEDYLPFWIFDADETSELHIRVTNNDTSKTGVFTVTIRYEKFA